MQLEFYFYSSLLHPATEDRRPCKRRQLVYASYYFESLKCTAIGRKENPRVYVLIVTVSLIRSVIAQMLLLSDTHTQNFHFHSITRNA